MKAIKDYISSKRIEEDPYDDLWQYGENPGFPSDFIKIPEVKSLEKLEARILELENRIKDLEGNKSDES